MKLRSPNLAQIGRIESQVGQINQISASRSLYLAEIGGISRE